MSTRSTDPFNDMPEEGKKMKRNMITAPFYAVFQNGCVVELSIKPLVHTCKNCISTSIRNLNNEIKRKKGILSVEQAHGSVPLSSCLLFKFLMLAIIIM